MATTDVAGRRRIGMFEKVESPSGNSYTQTSGRGNIAQFDVNGGPSTIVANTATSPRGLDWAAEEVGAIPMQPFTSTTPRTKL